MITALMDMAKSSDSAEMEFSMSSNDCSTDDRLRTYRIEEVEEEDFFNPVSLSSDNAQGEGDGLVGRSDLCGNWGRLYFPWRCEYLLLFF